MKNHNPNSLFLWGIYRYSYMISISGIDQDEPAVNVRVAYLKGNNKITELRTI
jgi:hypothetical protein